MIKITSVTKDIVKYELLGDYELQQGNILTIINAETGKVIYDKKTITFLSEHEIPENIIKESGNYIFQLRSFPNGGYDVKKQYIEVTNYKVGDIVIISKKVTAKEQGQALISVCLTIAIGKILNITDNFITLDCSEQFNSVIKKLELNQKYNIMKIPENLVKTSSY